MNASSSSSSARSVSFVSGVHRMDARLHEPAGAGRGAFVVAHPHPLHGGNMDHPVVVAAAERAAHAGLLALRFDFRGVRSSEGSTEDWPGHLEDWRRALDDAQRRAGGGPVLAGGFSYGARSLTALLQPDVEPRTAVRGVLLLAPATRVPRTKRDFGNLLLGRPLSDAAVDPAVLENLRSLPVAARVIVGENDVVAPHEELRAHLGSRAVLAVLPGLNHFFSLQRGAGVTDYGQLVPALDAAIEALLA